MDSGRRKCVGSNAPQWRCRKAKADIADTESPTATVMSLLSVCLSASMDSYAPRLVNFGKSEFGLALGTGTSMSMVMCPSP